VAGAAGAVVTGAGVVGVTADCVAEGEGFCAVTENAHTHKRKIKTEPERTIRIETFWEITPIEK
jgi:hypothetical protein